MSTPENYVDARGADAYSIARHGPDGAILLDPYFLRHLNNLAPGKRVIDIGCGAAPWTVHAAKAGATAVNGFDNSEHMLVKAKKAISHAQDTIRSIITIGFGTVKELPEDDASYDLALSLNVGCALPSIGEENDGTLSEHMAEMFRVLLPGGHGIITAPANLGIIFTTWGSENKKIIELKEQLKGVTSDLEVHDRLATYNEVLRATVVNYVGQYAVAECVDDIKVGMPILRKIPGLVVPNFVHDSEEYKTAIAKSGLQIVKTDAPMLQKDQCNQETGLGEQYTQYNPFVIYLVKKPL